MLVVELVLFLRFCYGLPFLINSLVIFVMLIVLQMFFQCFYPALLFFHGLFVSPQFFRSLFAFLFQFSRWQVAANAAAVVLVVLGMHLASDESWWFRHGTESQAFDRYVSIMSRVKQPTLIYYNTCTYGYGVPVGSLPGCKYWTSQSGATPAMVDDQLQAIKNRRADFVLSLRLVDKPQMFDSLGYYRYDPDTASAIILYARNPITEAL